MKVDRIYYYGFAAIIAGFLKWRSGFRRMKFIELKESGIKPNGFSGPTLGIKDERAILLWEAGYDHHISHFFRPEIPYSKSVDDAHCDTFFPHEKINCANHLYMTLAYDANAQSAEVLGCSPSYQGRGGTGVEGPVLKARHEGEPEKPLEITMSVDSALKGCAVHKSIDLDVIGGFPCFPKYSQGMEIVGVEMVQESLASLMQRADVVRLDIGGAYFEPMMDGRLRGKQRKNAMNMAFDTYRALLEVALDMR